MPKKIDRVLRYLKYAVLLILVFLLPFFWRSELGVGEPFFCKYLCPVGTLEGGVPLVLLQEQLKSAAGFLFRWKFALMALVLLSSVYIHRPFCKYLCPLGAFYALFQKVSVLRLKLDKEKCVSCGKCEKTCPMGVAVTRDPNSAECIRCGACVRACPAGALRFGSGAKKPGLNKNEKMNIREE